MRALLAPAFILTAAAAIHRPALAQLGVWTCDRPGPESGTFFFDPVSGTPMVFEGFNAERPDSAEALWSWSGAHWDRRPSAGPPVLNAAAYDSNRNVLVALGCTSDFGVCNQTWEWDGHAWAQRSPAATPGNRYAPSMAFDPDRGVVVMCGGANQSGITGFRDTWEWNGTNWRRTATSGFSGRILHSLAYDPARRVMVLFGGMDVGITSRVGDTYEYAGAGWTLRATTGPAPRMNALLRFDPALNALVLSGGSTSNNVWSAETWSWDGAAWTQRADSPLGPRESAQRAEDPASGAAWIFGGQSFTAGLGELWQDGPAPALLSTTLPKERDFHAMVHDDSRAELLVFGGRWHNAFPLGDTWVRTASGWTPRRTPGPSPRFSHAMTFDRHRGVAVLFGGWDGAVRNGETWEWNGAAWSRRNTPGPTPRYGHAMAYDAAREVTVLFGGLFSTGTPRNGETWEWDGAAWTQRLVSGPPPRAYHAMAYDAARGVTVLFGGSDHRGAFADTWEWNGAAWTLVPAAGPSARAQHAMSFDPAEGLVQMSGGSGIGANDGLWEWNGVAWFNRTDAGPLPRAGGAMAYDAAAGAAALFGGATFQHQLWLRAADCAPPAVTRSPDPVTTGPRASATLAMSYSGGGQPAFRWSRDGIPLEDEPGRRSGAASPVLTLDDLRPEDSGAYSCSVTSACGAAATLPAAVLVCPGDFDGDGFVDFFDYSGFVNAFESGGPHADVNRDGIVDFFDYLEFVEAFETGC